MGDSVLLQILRGTSDQNVRFSDLRGPLSRLGFTERIKGSHHVFVHEEIAEILNLQARSGLAKPYQVKQVRKVIVQYKLADRSL